MTDPVSDLCRTIAILSDKTKALEGSLSFRKGLEGIKQVKLDVELSRQKLQSWQETWSGQVRSPDGRASQSDITSKALWGVQGWENIQRILDTIKRASEKLEAALLKLQENAPRTRWKAAVRALRSKSLSQPHSKDQELKDLAAALNKTVDELWLYTETVFDSLHGVMSQDLQSPPRDILLQSALQSRAESLDTYWLCAKYPLDWSLEMNLLDASTMPITSLYDKASYSLHPSYHLFTQTGDDTTKLQKIVLEHVPREVLSLEQAGDVMQPDELESHTPNSSLRQFSQELILKFVIPTGQHGLTIENVPEGGHGFKPKSRVIEPKPSEPQMSIVQKLKPNPRDSAPVVTVTSKGSGSPSFLSITKKEVRLKSSPETLASILNTLKEATNNLSVHEHFSIGAKVELAYKVVECGFFLLGTPWFSSLRSINILRMKSTSEQRHKFVLRIQTLDMNDLLFDDAEALTEASQLHRIGVLLMEIALDKPEVAMRTEDYGNSTNRTSLLPLVEQTMGVQYCKATAFCLQYPQQQTRFQGLSKYESSHFQEWTSYLADFLQHYHSQVFLRLEELRDIDTSSEYRSRKSWQVYR